MLENLVPVKLIALGLNSIQGSIAAQLTHTMDKEAANPFAQELHKSNLCAKAVTLW